MEMLGVLIEDQEVAKLANRIQSTRPGVANHPAEAIMSGSSAATPAVDAPMTTAATSAAAHRRPSTGVRVRPIPRSSPDRGLTSDPYKSPNSLPRLGPDTTVSFLLTASMHRSTNKTDVAVLVDRQQQLAPKT